MPDDISVDQLGKGAVPQPPDIRDYDFSPIANASIPVDWTKEFRLPEPLTPPQLLDHFEV